MSEEKTINTLSLIKPSGQTFVFFYDDESVKEMMLTLGEYADDPELDFSWYDASVLSQRVAMMQKIAKQKS